MTNVRELPRLALAEVRVANGLDCLEPWERLAVLRHAVLQELLRCADTRAASLDFIAQLQADMAFAFLPAPTEPLQE